MTIILGIETTAHTFGVAIIRNGRILSNVKDAYTTESGGMIPLDVRKHHENVANELYVKALEECDVNENEIDAIAFSNAPGLAPCLIAGMEFVKKKARKLNISIVKVNHCIAHVVIGECHSAYPKLENKGVSVVKDAVMLYASGANTQIIAYEAGKYRVFGETLDLGVGNFIDTFARFAGLGFPGGPKIQDLAKDGKNLIELPYSIKGMDMSFAGLQTKLKNLLDKAPSFEKKDSLESENYIANKNHSTSCSTDVSQQYLSDLSYSLQEHVFAMLVEAAERALAHTGKKELLLGGGVACNSRLQEMCKIMCKERGVKYFCPARPLLVDNAGMIGYLGWKMFKAGIYTPIEKFDEVDIDARERTDMVEVKW